MQVQNQKAMESREAHQAHMLENQQKMQAESAVKQDMMAAVAPGQAAGHGQQGQ